MKEAGISINQNNPALTQVLELAGKDIKKVVISVFHIFKKLRHGKYNKDQISKLTQLKTIISELKNILDGINGRLDIVGERSMNSKAQQQKPCKMKQKK